VQQTPANALTGAALEQDFVGNDDGGASINRPNADLAA
jgi:hypothetical protein